MKTFIIILVASVSLLAKDQPDATIYSYPGNPDNHLEKRWEWAATAGKKTEGYYWIGYSFKRLMNENSFIGRYNEKGGNGSSLRDDIKAGFQLSGQNLSDEYRRTSIGGDSGQKAIKSIAVLFRIKGNNIEKININNLSLPFDLQSNDLYWMGPADVKQSVTKLVDIYQSTDNEEIKEECIMSVGMHRHETAFAFLKTIIRQENNSELRETAIFWLAESDFEGVFEELNWVIENDPSPDVRERAVFGFYLINNDQGNDALIRNAREAKEMNIRKQALFWLGQRASKKALETLESTVFGDEETELQSQAVFALSQLEDSKGLLSLIKAAKEHPNPQVRKKAIFWLGQMDDERALNVLVDIIQN